MPNIVESVNLISTTMGNMLDFITNDEVLSKDFEEYLSINYDEIDSEKAFNNIIVEYLLDMKMQNGLRVLEYFRRNNPNCDEVVDCLLNSVVSVFKINKISTNAYEAECLTSGVNVTLFPLVKISHLKQIGRYDYIVARVIELSGVKYLLEVYDIISEYNPYGAYQSAIRVMLINPKNAYWANPEKIQVLEESKEGFKVSFEKLFEKQYISTTNKQIDKLINLFEIFKEKGEKLSYSELIEDPETFRFFAIKEFNSDENSFLLNAIGGFSSHKEIYDVALWLDNKRGLYIIPFLKTFLKCFNEDIENKEDCIKIFLTSDKIPPSVIKYAYDNNENFLETVNSILKTNFSTLEELLFETKSAFVEEGIYSPVTLLYNCKLLSQLTQLKENKESAPQNKDVGRNDPCPCGSGLKFKNCCGKN